MAGAARQSASRWYKGNLHAHSINSDGDSPPYDLVAWYKRNGYHFLAITDHNTFTDPAPFDTNPNDDFLVIGAEEITNARTIHVNAIGISRVITPHKDGTVTDLLQSSIDAVREQAAVPLINHPNFLWAFTAAEMKPLTGVALLEIASGHPIVNHAGDGRVPSTEQMWDELLTGGMRIFAAAVDDSHHFREEFGAARANPGRAWVVVRAQALTRDAIVAALDAGDFYASNGPELRDVRHEGSTLVVEIAPSTGRRRYRVVFVGQNGRVLATSYDNPARYTLRGSESYVRARVEDSNGLRAWTQPLFDGDDDARYSSDASRQRPLADAAQPVARERAAAVGAERRRDQPGLVPAEHTFAASALHVPEAGGPVVRCRQRVFLVRTPDHCADHFRVPLEHAFALAGVRVPQTKVH
jgi:hypothetical protein